MGILEARTWLEILSITECWRLLRVSEVGRIGVLDDDGTPAIYPVNIAVDGESIVFRTDPGSKLAALQHHPAVAVEVDGIDLEARRGWSVLVRGTAVEIGGDELQRARTLPLHPWTIGDKARWIRIVARQVTGRAIHERSTRDDEVPRPVELR